MTLATEGLRNNMSRKEIEGAKGEVMVTDK